jgi:hypothetical protein
MGAKGTKNMTATDFKMIKTLADLNMTTGQIKQVTGRSYNTISVVKSSDSFEEYTRVRQSYNNRYKNKQPVSPEVESLSEAAGRVEAAESTPELIKALNDLSFAMNALALSWNGLAEKMDEVLETKRPWMFGQRKG